MPNTSIKQLEDTLGFFASVATTYNAACELKQWCEDKTQDLLHELELVQHTHHERGKIAQEIATVRQKRRQAKDTIEILDPLFHWTTNHIKEIEGLKRALGDMRKTDARHTNRLYYRRADGDHEIIGGR